MVKQIKFVIDASGQVELTVSGVTGNGCEKLTQPFEDRLGILKDRQYQDAYYQSEDTPLTVGLESEER